MPKKYNLDELIAQQQEIIQLANQLEKFPSKAEVGFRLLALRAVREFDLTKPQRPKTIQYLADYMPEVLTTLKRVLAGKAN